MSQSIITGYQGETYYGVNRFYLCAFIYFVENLMIPRYNSKIYNKHFRSVHKDDTHKYYLTTIKNKTKHCKFCNVEVPTNYTLHYKTNRHVENVNKYESYKKCVFDELLKILNVNNEVQV